MTTPDTPNVLDALLGTPEIQVDGVVIKRRAKLNFQGVAVSDNISEERTDILINTPTSAVGSLYNALRAQIANAAAGSKLFAKGHTTANDGGQGTFTIVSGGSYTDDGGTVLTKDGFGTTDSAAAIRDDVGPINLRWFGAVGDDSANDTTPVARWVLVVAASGKQGYAPAGIYQTDPITGMDLQMDIRGDGIGKTIFKSRAGDDVIEITGKSVHNLVISDCTIQGSGTNGGMGLNVHDNNFVFQITLRNVFVTNTDGHAVYIPEGYDMLLDGVQVDHCGGDGFVLGGAPCTTLINCYVHQLDGNPNRTGYRFFSGVPTLIGCNGLDSGTNADWATFGATTEVRSSGTTPPAVTLTGSSNKPLYIRAEITTGGTLGVAIFRYSIDDGRTWTSNVMTAASVAIAGTTPGLSFAFPAGTYSTDNIYLSDGFEGYVRANLIGCNIEDFTNRGVYCKGGSYINVHNTQFYSPASGTVTALHFDNTAGEAHIFDAASSCSLKPGGAWRNSYPVHVSSGRAPFVSHNTTIATYYSEAVPGPLPIPTVSIASNTQAFEVSALAVDSDAAIGGEVSLESGTRYTTSATFQTTDATVYHTTIVTAPVPFVGTYDVTVWASGVTATGSTVTLCARSVYEVADDGSLTARVASEAIGTPYDGITVGGLVVDDNGLAPGAIRASVTGKASTTIDWSIKADVMKQLVAA
jgi:hypothetical protein